MVCHYVDFVAQRRLRAGQAERYSGWPTSGGVESRDRVEYEHVY